MRGSDMPCSVEGPANRRVACPAPAVGIACSGLGRIRRGNETWARTVAESLYRSGIDVTLFGGGRIEDAACAYETIPTIWREFPLTRGWVSWHHRYLLEQISAVPFLLRRLRQRNIQVVHVADPDLALQVQKRARGRGVRVIYKDGLALGPEFSSRFDAVQVLAPHYLEDAARKGIDTANWFVIPHLVDPDRFSPAADKRAIRERLGIPAEAFTVLAVGDLAEGSNKRLGWVVQEFQNLPVESASVLMIAGQSSRAEFEAFQSRTGGTSKARLKVFQNLDSSQMVELYRAADVFVHAALREPFGIVFLEALASGLPVIAHKYPVTQWIVSDGGQILDMTEPGRLTAALEMWRTHPEERQAVGRRARRRAVSTFTEQQIVPLYQQMYRSVAEQQVVSR